MATYESFLKLNGSIGDLVFYNLNGKNVVRKKSGFNKTAFKKNPAYEKVRQNSSEFGHCSKVGKIIRSCISEYIAAAEDVLLYQKFAKTMTEIKDQDFEAEKGKRSVKSGLKTNYGKSVLQKFIFGNISNFDQEAQIFLGLWDKSLHFNKSIIADEIVVVTIKVDFENYHSEYFEEKINVEENQNEIVFQNYFQEENVIHFVAVKKNSQIVKMGFV